MTQENKTISAKYRTRQREELMQFFRENAGTHLTAQDVGAHLKAEGSKIGQSTVYRELERLVDEGVLNKYIIDGNSPACFEYVQPEEHHAGENCFHCKCEKCGKLIHLHCEELEELGGHLFTEHHFQMDPRRTVFYGICEECLKEGA